MSSISNKVTPNDVTELEREQLRFLLSGSDMAQALVELNPSLSWLPALYEMNLLKDDVAVAVWVEQNFASVDAVREVVANIRFFREESADILEFRLDKKRAELEPLLVKCWQLIIRHIRNTRYDLPYREWYEVLPRFKRSEFSTENLERIVRSVTPRLRIKKRFEFYDREEERKITEPSDLMTIRYEGDEGVNEQEFLTEWPDSAPPVVEARLIAMLTHALTNVLSDAIDVGIEQEKGLSLSDTDVPSVAAHDQNAYKHGLLTIVRITVELWVRLVHKDGLAGHAVYNGWKIAPFKLLRRMALFAATKAEIPASEAAALLLFLPQGELFVAHSSVEVHRLIRERWAEFSSEERFAIEQRVVEGPPADWFREGADIDRARDRYRFELLSDFVRSGIPLSEPARDVLQEILGRHPKWFSAEPERDGFLVWSGGVRSVSGDKSKLENVAPEELVSHALAALASEELLEGDAWQALAQSEPLTAFAGIERASEANRWKQEVWRPFLWAASKIADQLVLNRIAYRLATWPKTAPFDDVCGGAAWWLDEVADKLDDGAVWPVWDLIFERGSRRTELLNNDPFGTAINDAAGHLATVLLKKIPEQDEKLELSDQLQERFDRLVAEPGVFGLLVHVRFAAAIPFLYERARGWSERHIIPKFFWSAPDAGAMWSARKYSNHIGSADLFAAVKTPFLELFGRSDVGEEDVRVYADWLGFILVFNKMNEGQYALSPSEVRTALRRGGQACRNSFLHRLAIEMEGAKDSEKVEMWSVTIGPVFKGAWPLDLELQSSSATFKLVQLLRATGVAFAEAADVILPFVRAEDPRGHTSIFSLSHADQSLYDAAPGKMLELLSAVVGDAPPQSVFSLREALDKIAKASPPLVQSKPYQKLQSQASPHR